MQGKTTIESEAGWFGVRAAGVMIDEKNRVLLSRLEDDDLWVFPGGGIGLHEALKEAVKRELFEETNFEIEVQRLLWILENYFVFNEKKHHCIEFYFLVSPKESTGIWEQDEFLGQEEYLAPGNFWKLPERSYALYFKWFDISRLNEINFKPTIFIEHLKDIPKHPKHIVWDDYGRTSYP